MAHMHASVAAEPRPVRLPIWSSGFSLGDYPGDQNPIAIAVGGTWKASEVREPGNAIYDAAESNAARRWKFYYAGRDGSNDVDIGVAFSPDGTTWTDYVSNPVISLGEDPYVVCKLDGSLYRDGSNKMHLFCEQKFASNTPEQNGINHYTSTDGVTWTADPANPVIEPSDPGNGAWETADITSPVVWWDEMRQKMYLLYEARDSTGDGSMALAWSTDGGTTWTRSPNNPIIPDSGSGGSGYGSGSIVPDDILLSDDRYFILCHGKTAVSAYSTAIAYTNTANPEEWSASNVTRPAAAFSTATTTIMNMGGSAWGQRFVFMDDFVTFSIRQKRAVPESVAPINVYVATITGSFQSGQTLTRVAGGWWGPATITVTGEWYVDGVGTGSTGTTFLLDGTHVGKTVTYVETATNGFGSTQASSAGGVVTVYTPAALGARLVAWFDATSDSYLTFSSGAVVSQWNDRSSNAYHLTQATVGKQPTRSTSVQNSHNAITFGSPAVLKNATLPTTQPVGIWIVCRETSQNGFVIDGLTSGTRNAIFNLTPNWSAFAGSQLNGTSTTTPMIVGAVFNGGSSSFRLNGALTASGAIGAQVLAGISVGSRFNETQFHTGWIGEIVICASPSAGDIADIEAYLNGRWAIY